MSRTLDSEANAVQMEFGGIFPESLLSFEDCRREYAYTRALELQKLGISPSDRTVTVSALSVSTREGAITMPDGVGDMIPAAVEFLPTGGTRNRDEQKVVILSNVEDVPSYEGTRAIAFYGEPLKYRLAWDAWSYGTLYLYYDPVEDVNTLAGTTTLTFPLAFWTFLIKKTAVKLIDIVKLKMMFLGRVEDAGKEDAVMIALSGLQKNLLMQSEEWQREFERFITTDKNETPYLRRTQMEISARSYNDQSDGAFSTFE